MYARYLRFGYRCLYSRFSGFWIRKKKISAAVFFLCHSVSILAVTIHLRQNKSKVFIPVEWNRLQIKTQQLKIIAWKEIKTIGRSKTFVFFYFMKKKPKHALRKIINNFKKNTNIFRRSSHFL